jgi:hypothetical protein
MSQSVECESCFVDPAPDVFVFTAGCADYASKVGEAVSLPAAGYGLDSYFVMHIDSINND